MRVLQLTLAGLFFALAVLGAFLPVLPTTPFLLLTSYFLMRSSPRLNAALRRSPLFGPLLTDWERQRGVRLHVKVAAVSMIVLLVGATLVFGGLVPWLRWTLVGLALLGLTVVLRLRTVRDG